MIQTIDIDGKEIIVASIHDLDDAIELWIEKYDKTTKWQKTYTFLAKTANERVGFKRYTETFNKNS